MRYLTTICCFLVAAVALALPPQAFQSQWMAATDESEEASWTPAELTTAILWLDASDVSTITTNADGINNVEKWDDKSGNDYDVIQEYAGSATYGRFGFEENIQNGLSAMYLHTSDSDTMTNSIPLFTNSNVSIFYVVAITNRTGDWLIAQHPGDASVGRMLIGTDTDSPYNKSRFFFNNGATRTSISTSIVADATAHIGYIEHDGAGRSATRIDGGDEEGILESQTWTPYACFFSVGRSSGSAVSGYIFEILITCPKLEEADRIKVEEYLKTKWDI